MDDPPSVTAYRNGPLEAGFDLPFTLMEVAPLPHGADGPTVELDDPVPSILADLLIPQSVALGGLVRSRGETNAVSRRRSRNEKCWCGSGRKEKACHRDGLVPKLLVQELSETFDHLLTLSRPDR